MGVLGTARQQRLQLQLGAIFHSDNHCYSSGTQIITVTAVAVGSSGGFLCSHLAYFVIFTFALQKDKVVSKLKLLKYSLTSNQYDQYRASGRGSELMTRRTTYCSFSGCHNLF